MQCRSGLRRKRDLLSGGQNVDRLTMMLQPRREFGHTRHSSRYTEDAEGGDLPVWGMFVFTGGEEVRWRTRRNECGRGCFECVFLGCPLIWAAPSVQIVAEQLVLPGAVGQPGKSRRGASTPGLFPSVVPTRSGSVALPDAAAATAGRHHANSSINTGVSPLSSVGCTPLRGGHLSRTRQVQLRRNRCGGEPELVPGRCAQFTPSGPGGPDVGPQWRWASFTHGVATGRVRLAGDLALGTVRGS